MRDKVWFMALVLGLVGVIAGVALSSVKTLTDPVIESRVLEQKIKPSLETFFEPLGADNDFIADRRSLDLGKDARGRKLRLTVFKATRQGQLIGAALQTASGGYGGDIQILTVLDLGEQKILGTKALDQSETKGLGARVSDDTEPFIQQWRGMSYKNGVALKSDGGQVDVISGATISSTAFTAAVAKALELMASHRQEIEQEAP